MNRRGFLASLLAAGTAPAIVRAENLMRCSGIIIPGRGVYSYEIDIVYPEPIAGIARLYAPDGTLLWVADQGLIHSAEMLQITLS